MSIAIIMVLLVLFAVFMLTAEGVSDSSKRIVIAIIVIVGLILLYKVIWG